MNILSIIFRYHRLKNMPKAQLKNEVPRVHIFAGKSAPGYYIAKLVIKLINSVGDVVNKDPDTRDYLKASSFSDSSSTRPQWTDLCWSE